MTVRPSSFAHCDTMSPTPPAAACSRIESPDFSGQIRRIRYDDVRPRIVIAAAVSQEIASGSLISGAAGIRRSVLYAPSVLTKPVYVTRSPGATLVTPSPTASTTPAASTPMPAGRGTG